MKSHRIGEILHLQRRRVAVDPTTHYTEIGTRSFGRGIFHKEPVLGAELGGKRVFWIEPGDLIFNNVFAWEGAVALAGEGEIGKVGSHRFLTYVPDRDLADPLYLRYFFLSQRGLRLLKAASPGSAGRNRTLAIERFAASVVELHNVEEQRRIGGKLHRTFALGHRYARSARESQRVSQAIRWAYLRTLFSALLETGPTSTLADGVDLNPEPGDPLSEPGQTFRYVDIGAIKNGSGNIEWPQELPTADAPSRARRRIRAGDIVVSTVRPNLRGSALVPPELDGAIASTGLAVLRPRPGVDSDFLLYQALSDPFVDQLTGESRGGHYPAVNDARLRTVRIAIPAVATQRAAVGQLKSVVSSLDRIADLRQLAETQFRALELSILERAFEQAV